MPIKLNADVDLILNLYKKGMTFSEISSFLNISKDTVRNRLRGKGIFLNPGRVDSGLCKNKKQIVELYKNGMSMSGIAKYFSISYSSVRKVINFYGVQKKVGSYKTVKINHESFSSFNPDSCYWAGFIAADGNVWEDQLSIHLSGVDFLHLEKFLKFIGCKNSGVYYNKDNSCRVRFRSSEMVRDLNKHFNIVPNKSLILEPPNINDISLIRHFVRGYFDGDGCFSVNSNSKNMSFEIYSGSSNILEWILHHIKHVPINTRAQVKIKASNTYRFCLCGNIQVPKIMNWLYKDASCYLDRKKEKYTSCLEVI